MFYQMKTGLVATILIVAGILLFRMCLRPEFRRMIDVNLVAVVLATLATAFLVPSAPLTLLLYTVIVVAGSRGDPQAAARLALVMLPLVPLTSYTIGGFGPIQSVLTMSVSMMLGLGVLIVGLAKGQFRLDRLSQGLPLLIIITFIAFVLIYIVLLNRGFSATTYMRGVVSGVLSTILLIVMIATFLFRSEDSRRFIIQMAAVGVGMAFIAIFERIDHWLLFDGVDRIKGGIEGISQYTKARGGGLRSSGPFGEPISFSIYLGVVLLIVVALYRQLRSVPVQYGIAAFVMFGLLMTQSRTGLVAAYVGVTLVLLYQRRWGLGSLALGFGAVVGIALSAGALDYFKNPDGSEISTSDYRKMLLSEVLRQLQGNFLLGDNQIVASGRLDMLIQGEGIVDFVNSYLMYLTFGGLVSLGALLAFMSLSFLACLKLRHSHRSMPELAPVTATSFGVIGAIAVAFVFTAPIDRNPVWLYVAAAVAIAAIGRFRREQTLRRRAMVEAVDQSEAEELADLIEGRRPAMARR
jgi:hypothetical protein